MEVNRVIQAGQSVDVGVAGEDWDRGVRERCGTSRPGGTFAEPLLAVPPSGTGRRPPRLGSSRASAARTALPWRMGNSGSALFAVAQVLTPIGLARLQVEERQLILAIS